MFAVTMAFQPCVVLSQDSQQTAQAAESPARSEAWQARFHGSKADLIVFEKNCTVSEALRILASLYQKNIVPCGKVDGLLGFTRLVDVTFEEALDAVLGIDYVAEPSGSLIKVYRRDDYKKIQEEAKKAQEEEARRLKLAQEEAKKAE
ncbi:MAG: hypothetical protein QHH07_12610, partial [Sedimentisphaerales bacterium]|nr:hypothetical protein [Sedimentisphaerales bacterium]